MTLIRVVHNKNYVTVNNTIAEDDRLSWKAKGIWFYAFTRIKDWQFYTKDIIKRSTDGRDSVYSGLKELEEAGYLERKEKRENGQITNPEWVFYETPQKKNPQTENPDTVRTDQVNRPLTSIKVNKYEKKNNNNTTLTKELSDPVPNPVVVPSSNSIQKPPQQSKEKVCKEVLIPSCLSDLLSVEESKKLLLLFTLEVIKNAVECLHSYGNSVENTFGFLKKACEKGWKPKLKKEESEEKNKTWWNENHKHHEDQNFGTLTINRYCEYVEFYRGGVGCNAECFRFDDQKFIEKVQGEVRKWRNNGVNFTR